MISPRRQGGAIGIMLALMLLGLITMLGLVEVGYLYWAHRDVQKVADLAALSGVVRLGSCDAGIKAAKDNATTDNSFPKKGTVDAECGYWSPSIAGAQHFQTDLSKHSPNAMLVTASLPLTPFFGFAHLEGKSVSATAIAADNEPIAAFSVGSQTAGLNSKSLLNNFLNESFGTSLGLSLLNDTGIIGANISLLNLVRNSPLNIGTLDSVLNTNITVEKILDAYLQTLTQKKDAANLNLTLLQEQISAIDAKLGDIPIHLGQILDVNAITSDPTKALNASIGALNILKAIILAADSNNAVAIPSANVDVPGVANVDLMASVVEPPQIGVGGVGATAHTAQIRLALDLNPLTVLNLLGLSVAHLSVAVEVAPSTATIEDITCNAPSPNGATNDVTIKAFPGLANIGIANYGYLKDAFQNTNQTWSSILEGAHADEYSGWDKIVDALGLAKIYLFANVELNATSPFSHTFEVDPSVPISDQPDMTFPASLDDDPSTQSGQIVSSLLNSDIDVGVKILGIIKLPVGSILKAVSPLLTSLLSPVLSDLVDPLLKAVGIEIGTAQVALHSVNCHAGVQLVY